MSFTANDGSGGSDSAYHVEVDVNSLQDEVTRLQSLRDYLNNQLIPQLATVATTIKSGNVAFGSFSQAQTAASTHDQFYQSVLHSYADIAKKLDEDAKATQQILDNYKSADARNAANAGDIDKIFGTAGSGGGGGTGTGTGL